jgi:drug/metabolite transporter (DMT)-like permease
MTATDLSSRIVAPCRTPPPVRSLLVPLLGLLWGFNWPAVRISLTEIAPWTFAGRRHDLCRPRSGRGRAGRAESVSRCRKSNWPRLIVAGILSIAAFNILLAFAQLMAPTSRAAILTFTMPVWATLMAWPALGERFDRPRLIGLGLGIAGLLCLGLPLIRAGQFSPGLALAFPRQPQLGARHDCHQAHGRSRRRRWRSPPGNC